VEKSAAANQPVFDNPNDNESAVIEIKLSCNGSRQKISAGCVPLKENVSKKTGAKQCRNGGTV
jgi:hypothetical protein